MARSRNTRWRPVQRKLQLERLEDRRVFAALAFDSVLTIGDGSNPTSAFGGVEIDDAGNRIVSGYFQGNVDFDPNNTHLGDIDIIQSVGSADNAFVAKYDSTGVLTWVRGMGGVSNVSGENARGKTVGTDLAGDVYVAGTFKGTVEVGGSSLVSAGDDDVFVAKLNANTGEVEWAVQRGSSVKDDILDEGLAVSTAGTVDLAMSSGGQADIVRLAADTASLVWQGSIVGAGRLAAGNAGELYISGAFREPFDADPGAGVHLVEHDPPVMSPYLVKLDAGGNFEWVRYVEASGANNFATLLSITTDRSGNVLLSGDYWSNSANGGVVDFDDRPGVSVTLPENLHRYVTKFDSSGQLIWARPLVGELNPKPGEASSSMTIRLTADSSDNLYATGNFRGVLDLDSGDGVVSVESIGPTSANLFTTYLVGLTSDAQFRYGTSLGNEDASVSGIGIAVDAAHRVHLAGSFYGAVDFDPGSGVEQVTSAGRSAFVLTLNPAPGITVSRTTGLTTSESGAVASISLSLDTQPIANVTISAAVSDSTEGRVSTSTLVFTPADWNIPQALMIEGVDDHVVDGDQSFTVTLSAASVDGDYHELSIPPIALINLDNDQPPPTKFYVVNDGSDRTYEYAADGSAIENYGINSGNSAPRGAASTAEGTKVWVADKNRKVYIYDDNGALQGSWSAGTLGSTAQVEGLATNGTDVWIVDGKSDKVYRYANAAGRLSGSQNAASSFSLNSSNKNPKGIVTDGAHLWVVDDNSTDKVFKYTVSGSLVGSWTIDSANKTPTGLTIDPSIGSQSIWIVDSGTDRVYEYANARGKTSGSLAAAATFNLAAGNSNPQGIADPPPPSSAGSTVSAATRFSHALTPLTAGGRESIAMPQLGTATQSRLFRPAARQRFDSAPLDEVMHQLGTVSAAVSATEYAGIRVARRSANLADQPLDFMSEELDRLMEAIATDVAGR